jgi:hypothetical protein
MAKLNIVRLADNIPLSIVAKYCDVFIGEYGPDLRFNGTVDGQPNSAVYVFFKTGIEQLRAIGAITAKVHAEAIAAVEKDAVPDTGFSVGLTKKELTLLSSKPAGQKHGTLQITVTGEPAPLASARPMSEAGPTAATEAAANGNGNGNALREKRSALYKAMTTFVLDTIVPMYDDKNIPVVANDVHSMVATLYIAETRT